MGILWNRCFFACHCNSFSVGLRHQSPGTRKENNQRNRHCIPKLRISALLSLTPRVLGTLTFYGWTISQEVSWLLRQTDYWGPGPPALNTCLDMSKSEVKKTAQAQVTEIWSCRCAVWNSLITAYFAWSYKALSYPASVYISRLSPPQTLLGLSSPATLNYCKHLHFIDSPGLLASMFYPCCPNWVSHPSFPNHHPKVSIFLYIFTTTALLHRVNYLLMFNELSQNLVT